MPTKENEKGKHYFANMLGLAETEPFKTDAERIVKVEKDVEIFQKLFKNTYISKILRDNLEKQSRFLDRFRVPREDPDDIFKPNSKLATQLNVEYPWSHPLNQRHSDLLHEIAIYYDYCSYFDIVSGLEPETEISAESKAELDKLPSWLKFLCIIKYDLIYNRYEEKTHKFLQGLADRIDQMRTGHQRVYVSKNEDVSFDEEISDRFRVTRRDVWEGLKEFHSNIDNQSKTSIGSLESDSSIDIFSVAAKKWLTSGMPRREWMPMVIRRVAVSLRQCLLAEPSGADVAIVEEEKKVLQIGKSGAEFINQDDWKSKRTLTWEELSADEKHKIAKKAEKDLHHIPGFLVDHEKKEEEKMKQHSISLGHSPMRKLRKFNQFIAKKIREKRLKTSNTDEVKAVNPTDYRRYSKIWYKGCPQTPVQNVTKFRQLYRKDQAFYNYIVTLVESKLFRTILMLVIIVNALMLALETPQSRESASTTLLLSISDNFFLSVYTIEFVLKVYAHPYLYWTSGFNLFDFAILVASLGKSIADWTDVTGRLGSLKLLIVARALRILRSVSFSPQISVLVTALVEVLKTHVLSVLILLLLLMYIAAVSAYYMFSSVKGLDDNWSDLHEGMLQITAFVTKDGWTDMFDEFEEAGILVEGKIFALVGILLGNFLISNIFIAIIIMQISEATETFRNLQKAEREEITSVKKEIVFRRQKLDMRQLLAKQSSLSTSDFQHSQAQFLKLLSHEDLLEMNQPAFSPLWIDALSDTVNRIHKTANILMNLHRQMSENLMAIYRSNKEKEYKLGSISRARYSRYMKLKAKMQLIRREFYHDAEGIRSHYTRKTYDESIQVEDDKDSRS